MPYLDTADALIDALHRQIGPKHALYRRDIFPVALRRDPDAIIWEIEDEPQRYVLAYQSLAPFAIRKRGNVVRTEILANWQALQVRIDMDNAEWLAQFR